MREIKFKAKNLNSEWVYGYVFDDGIIGSKRKFIGGLVIQDYKGTADDDYVIDTNLYEVDPDTLCQYTGLKDKYGTEIYENDKMLDEYYEEYGTIEWDKNTAMFVVSFDGWCTDFDHINEKNLEVVGSKLDEIDYKEFVPYMKSMFEEE